MVRYTSSEKPALTPGSYITPGGISQMAILMNSSQIQAPHTANRPQSTTEQRSTAAASGAVAAATEASVPPHISQTHTTEHWMAPWLTKQEKGSNIMPAVVNTTAVVLLPAIAKPQSPKAPYIPTASGRQGRSVRAEAVQQVAAAPLHARDGGRIGKRKRRTPTRSLSLHDRDNSGNNTNNKRHARAFQTLRMSYLDDYQRDPMAYSRALMGTERPKNHSGYAATTAAKYSIPSTPADTSNSNAMSAGGSKSSAGGRACSSASTSSTSSPLPEYRRSPVLRKSMSAAIHRLFPSLSESTPTTPASTTPATATQMSAALAPAASDGAAACTSEGGLHIASSRTHNMSLVVPYPAHNPSSSLVLCSPSSAPTTSSPSSAAAATHSHSNTHSTLAPPRQRSHPPTATSKLHDNEIKPNASGADNNPFITDELSREIFNLRPVANSCPVKWAKAAPVDVSDYPMVEWLSRAERDCCSILRLFPEQYLAIKQSLVRAGRTMPHGTFKK
ncbi:hypothetical protein GQ54DRAFT_340030, partial [Martensiomyces pterosporus]